MDEALFESLKRYMGFGPEASATLRAFHPIAKAHLPEIIDDFYAAIDAHPRAREVITGGQAQVERLKGTLLRWIDTVLLGPHDREFLESHSRIGRVHVRIGLAQEYMFTAMNRIRTRLVLVAAESAASEGSRRELIRALDGILDIELMVMLDTYREHMNDRVRGTERLATIGQMAATIGHELRNPLGTMESSLFLLGQHLTRLGPVDPQVKKHQDRIQRQITNSTKIITNLLNLARDRPPQRRHERLRAVIDRALEGVSVPKEIELEIAVPEELRVFADPDDLAHVINNLVLNAEQAQAGVGRIRISAGPFQGGVEFRVQDDGPGVPAENRNRIFDALFTTKSSGTGLGLALCWRVVSAHHGEIQLEPSKRGARFRVWLPAEPDARADAKA